MREYCRALLAESITSIGRRRMLSRGLLARVLLTLSLLGSGTTITSSADAKTRPLVVRTQQGWLQGTRSDGVDRFLAVPYAAPPVGELRWRPPAPPAPWWGLRAANELPPRCAQIGADGEEDCLYLNIYRPAHTRRTGPLPVLFFIHGGSFRVGSSFDNDPSRIAASTDSIVVMINYRLGQFGFLAHPALGAEAGDGSSGEYGLMDQQAALSWVNAQIAAFGGDPNQVTIAGNSAGGMSVCAHLTSAPVAGLFAGAVMQSGSCLSVPLTEAETMGVAFAEAAGCPDTSSMNCLRQKTTAEFLASDSWAWPVAVVSGGRLLPEAPLSAVSAGNFSQVPVMIGGARNEAHSGVAAEFPMPEEEYVSWIHETFGDAAAAILERYPADAYADPVYAFADVVDDSGIAGVGSCASLQLARTFAEHVPTYVYEFADSEAPNPSWVNAPPGYEVGASHGSDEVYWFDRPQDTVEPLDWSQAWLAHKMVQYLGAFTEHGTPRVRGQRHWPRFTDRHERVLQFRQGPLGLMRNLARRNHCGFWSSVLAR